MLNAVDLVFVLEGESGSESHTIIRDTEHTQHQEGR